MGKKPRERASNAQGLTLSLCNTLPKDGKYKKEYKKCVAKAKEQTYRLLANEKNDELKKARKNYEEVTRKRKDSEGRNTQDYKNAARKRNPKK